MAQADRANFETSANSFHLPKSGIEQGTNFLPVTASDLLAEGPEPIVWVWDGFLPEGGLVAFTAFMKVGKSTLIYPLAVAVSQGREFLGYPTKQCGVLILAVEEDPRDIKNRLLSLGLRGEDPLYVHRGFLTYGQATLNKMGAFIEANEIGLVLLDTLSSYWQIRDENNNAEVISRVRPILNLARETRCAVLLVHHESKRGGDFGRSIRGGSALLGIVDLALMYDRLPGGNQKQRILRALGRYAAQTPAELVVELIGDEFRNIGPPDTLGPLAVREKVLNAIRHGPKDVQAIAIETHCTQKAIRTALESLGECVLKEGEGKKRDPFRYRQA